MHHRMTRCGFGLLLVALGFALGGCASYSLSGAVVEGDIPGAYLVDAGDPRLEQQGIADARLEITIDPNDIRPKKLAPFLTDGQGRFDAPVPVTGAGVLNYEMVLFCRRKGYAPVWQRMPLPGTGRRLLIVMEPGIDRDRPEARDVHDIWKDAEKVTPR